ncbi:hypothetical protein EML15_04460 [Corynebacterium sp. sy017]|uniref:sensor histidine kinase n=1 Tax=unclassified Corynebacterium TaxID=2624378 RepID=UPI0011865CF4|nr:MULTISPECIES: histidine kinase [unclassified Corynebacterium]MBP3088398.1 hypothetical protein [Corynebacterium sp. sy017]QDZ41840.1 hypothetical protein FQV43_00650 [Corynebacterium sp. sy039]TSD91712.1 hypothetical protein ELY17_04460 [Corynebacterium sp. SY003]
MRFIPLIFSMLYAILYLIQALQPSWLSITDLILAILLCIATGLLETRKYLVLGAFLILGSVCAWQLAFIHALPNNTGITLYIVLVPWALYKLARSSHTHSAALGCLFAGAGSIISPLMWRIKEYDFGYGLTYLERPQDIASMLVAHWSVILLVLLWGKREREKQVQVRAEERTRIAAEVHDTLAHSLAVIRMQASAGIYAPDQAQQALQTIQQIAGEGIEEVRTFISSLHSDATQTSLATVIDRFRSSGMDIDAELDNHLPPSTIMYKALSETLTNAAKHQLNAKVYIRATYNKSFELDILSIGPIQQGKGNGIGLKNLQEKIAAHDGIFSFRIDGEKAHTHICLSINN